MKILHLCQFFYPAVGGWETLSYNICRELARRGHDVTVYTCDENQVGKRIGKRKEKIAGIKVERFPVVFRAADFYRVWPKFIRKLQGFEIVDAHGLRHFHSDMAAIEKKKYGYGLVLHSGNAFMRKSFAAAVLQKAHTAAISKHSNRLFDKVIALHEKEKERLVEYGIDKKKIVVMHNPIEDVFLKKGNGKKFRRKFGIKGNIVMYAGRLHRLKNVETLIEAAMHVKEKEAEFVIIGSGNKEYETFLKQFAKKVKRNFKFIPEIADKKALRDAYAAASIFVLPSSYEPFGISLLEAMSQGCAIIAARSDGPEYVLGKNRGILFEAGNEIELARRINELLEDAVKIKKLAAKGRGFAKMLTYKKYVGRLEKIYKGLR